MEFHCQARCHHRPQGQCSLYGLNLHLDNGGGNSHTRFPVDCLKRWQSITHRQTHRFNALAPIGEKWNGKPRLACVNVRHSPWKTPVGVMPWTCRDEGRWPSRETGGRGNPTSGLRLWIFEVLRRHYPRAQSQGPHTIAGIAWMREM